MSDIISGNQWGCQKCPQAHLSPVLILGQLSVSNLEHVWIVPMPRSRKFAQSGLRETDCGDAFVVIVDIITGAPSLCSCGRGPLPACRKPMLAETVKDRAAGRLQCLMHRGEGLYHHPFCNLRVSVSFVGKIIAKGA